MSSGSSRAKLYLAIHGDKQQNERDWVLNEFKTGKSPIMVATDVASRGIGMIDHCTALSLSSPFSSCEALCNAWLSAFVCSAFTTVRFRLVMTFGYLAKDSWISNAVWLATFLFRLVMYRQGTEADLGFSLICSSRIPEDIPGP